VDIIEHTERIIRRRHDAALKAQVRAECPQPKAAVAGITLVHGRNANLMHKWRRMAAAP
jgi:transposase